MADMKKYTDANRIAWNEANSKHQEIRRDKLDKLFADPEYISLDEEILNVIRADIKEKNFFQPCCNNGTELLSLKRLGAARCTGMDISDEAISEATDRCKKVGLDVEYLRSDIYDATSSFENSYDVILITVGTLGWMPDLQLFFEKMASFLKKDGMIIIHEMHPFGSLFPDSTDPETDKSIIKYNYFEKIPDPNYAGIDYVGNANYESSASYFFNHRYEKIFNAMVKHKLSIERLEEFEKDISMVYGELESLKKGLPLSYLLLGKKR